ncbi:hypothetical protein J7K97_03680 [Candidatus Aerophobetes bacterium]|nr:hypothetical protein [Candidatus Aerophobetes bacterium]
MWIKDKEIPEKGVEFKIFNSIFLFKPFPEGVNFYQQKEGKWNLLNILSVERENLKFSLLPKPYELPVFVRFEQTLDIYPKREFNFFLQIPFKCSLRLESGSESWEIIEVEEKSLKQIWDAQVTSPPGFLYYYFVSPLMLNYLSQKSVFPFIPLKLINPTKGVVRVQRVIIDEKYLNIYILKQKLITGVVEVSLTKEGRAKAKYVPGTLSELKEKSKLFMHSSAAFSPATQRIFSPIKKLRSIFEIEY